MILPTFEGARLVADPFPHMRVDRILAPDAAGQALAWLRERAPWALRVESFYEQHEFSLLAAELGPEVEELVSAAFIDAARTVIQKRFDVSEGLTLVDVSAHRLTSGQTIRIHNDFLDGQETHRLLIQLNDGWDADRGGLLMLFAGEAPESLRHVIMPTHASGFIFEISPTSFHAVSSIRSGERFTLVYTFQRDGTPV